MGGDSIIFDSCAFVAGIFLLQAGAYLFTTNTAAIARRCGIPETLTGLLTAGAEWEELAIVIASIMQRTPSLGLGNIIGSCISNIMGAFALGLLFHVESIHFDITTKIYSLALFVVSTLCALLLSADVSDQTKGIFFVIAFSVYVMSICSAIYDRILGSNMEGGVSEAEDDVMVTPTVTETPPAMDHQELGIAIYPSVLQCHPDEATSLLPNHRGQPDPAIAPIHAQQSTSIAIHLLLILVGITALGISSYIITHTAFSLATSLHISPTLIGITLLSFSTTIPEKIISVFSNWQRRNSVMTATMAGSNIFLLTLCLGVVFIMGTSKYDNEGQKSLTDELVAFEVWNVWGCSVLLMVVTWTGAKSWMGGLLFGCYLAFLGCEVSVYKR